jgi:hypothetical protein
MNTKLTLRLDSDLIEKAKVWSRNNDISLSKAVSNFFENMDLDEASESELSPWVLSLLGSVPNTSEGDLKAEYYDRMEEKYK